MKISAVTFIHNGLSMGYPFVEAASSVLPYVDEYVLVDCDSNDGTQNILAHMAETSPKFRLHRHPWPVARVGGRSIGEAQDDALAFCSHDWRWLVQADEVWWPESCDKLREVLDEVESQGHPFEMFSFPIRHMVGWDRVLDDPAAYSRCVRVIRGPRPRSAGDGWTFAGGSSFFVMLPQPIHHYGWVFRDQTAEKRIRQAALYPDLPGYQEAARAAQSGTNPIDTMTTAPYTGRHPEIMCRLLGRSRYEVPVELLEAR